MIIPDAEVITVVDPKTGQAVPTRVSELENDSGYVRRVELPEGAPMPTPLPPQPEYASKEQGRKADSAVQPDDLVAFGRQFATHSQGEAAASAVQPDAMNQALADISQAFSQALGGYVTSADMQNYATAFATAEQGAKADSAVQPGALSAYVRADALPAALGQYVTSTALASTLAGYATKAQGDKADSAVQPQALASYATTTALTQAIAGRATSAQGGRADTALQPPIVPVGRTLAFATAYRADQTGKSAMLSIMVRFAYTVTLVGLMADEVELRIGPDDTVATGGGHRIATAEGALNGISLTIGTSVVTRQQLCAMIPPGWYFAVRRLAGTGATIQSAFVQPFG